MNEKILSQSSFVGDDGDVGMMMMVRKIFGHSCASSLDLG